MQEAWSEVTLGRILQKNNRQTFKNTSVTKHFIPLTFSYFGVIAISPQLQQQQHSNASEFRYTCLRSISADKQAGKSQSQDSPGRARGGYYIGVTTRPG